MMPLLNMCICRNLLKKLLWLCAIQITNNMLADYGTYAVFLCDCGAVTHAQ